MANIISFFTFIILYANYNFVSGILGQVSFHLYTRKNNLLPEKLDVNKPMDSSSKFSSNLPVKIISHGWKNSAHFLPFLKLKDAYLEKYDVNVILVDWQTLANQLYVASAENTRIVGDKTAKLVLNLLKSYNNLNKDMIHLIGHSLGSHVVGFAGQHLIKNGVTVARITGLDPANPFFEDLKIIDGLEKSNAKFVDVIHTNAGHFGVKHPIGVADFYPNGGAEQPSCAEVIDNTCSHMKVLEYFTESIKHDKFQALKCNAWENFTKGQCDKNEVVMMGESCPNTARGIYYLNTK